MHALLATLFALTAVGAAAATPPPPDASPAFTNPGFANPDTPGLMDTKPAPSTANASDVAFLKTLAMGSRAEVELGKLAGSHASTPAVKSFAQRMVKDHTDANARLGSAAGAAKVELPKELDPDHAALRESLSKQDGRDFDMKYVDSQIRDHAMAVQLLIYEVDNGQSSDARRFAAQTLPTVMEHLEMAKSLHEQLTQ